MVEQSHWGLEDCYVRGSYLAPHPSHLWSNQGSNELRKGLLTAVLEAFQKMLSWVLLQQCTEKTWESPIDFHQCFVEAFSELSGWNLGSDQNVL